MTDLALFPTGALGALVIYAALRLIELTESTTTAGVSHLTGASSLGHHYW